MFSQATSNTAVVNLAYSRTDISQANLKFAQCKPETIKQEKFNLLFSASDERKKFKDN